MRSDPPIEVHRVHRCGAVLRVAGLILLSDLALAASMRVWVVPAIIALLLLSFLATGRPAMPRPRTFLAILLVIPFALWWRNGVEALTSQAYVPVAMLFLIGFYMLCLATHHLLAWNDGGSGDYAVGCSVMALGVAGSAERNELFAGVVLAFGLLLLFHLRAEMPLRSGRRTLARPPLRRVAAWVLLWAVVALMQLKFVPAIPRASNWLVHRMVEPQNHGRFGFDRSASLRDVQRMRGGGGSENDAVMLRVFAHRVEPYLRGAVYGRYDRQQWQMIGGQTLLEPVGSHLGRHLFQYQSNQSGELIAVVYPAREVAESFFLPLDTNQVGAYASEVLVDSGGTMWPREREAVGGYAIYDPGLWRGVETATPLYFEEFLKPNLEVPAELLEPITAAANAAMPNWLPPLARVRRLEAWFTEGFRYEIGAALPQGMDPILGFLGYTRAGHCELFASAAVLMLRSASIPARYVTGFMATERGLGPALWLARRRHAHAWAEAWVEGHGWVTVEATPPSGRPTATAASAWQQRREWFAAQWQRFTRLVFHGGIGALFTAMWGGVASAMQGVAAWVWALVMCLAGAFLLRKRLRAMLFPPPHEPVPPRVRRLRQDLIEAERRVERYGLMRPASMSVGRFLRLIRGHGGIPSAVRQEVAETLEAYLRERFRRP